MAKLYLKILLFIIPLFLAAVFYPVDKRLRYENLENDCFNHGKWIYDRTFVNETPINLAFFGSSRTINGISDELVEKHLELPGFRVANLGYCRQGRNLTYTLAKDLLKVKKPDYVVIELNEMENDFSHPVFPNLADERDAFWPRLFLNRNLGGDLVTALMFKFQLMQQVIFNTEKEASYRPDLYGHSTFNDTAGADWMSEVKAKRKIPAWDQWEIEKKIYRSYPWHYLNKTLNLCKAHGVEVLFLYLPPYGSKMPKPLQYDEYVKHGKVLIPPVFVTENPDHWHDHDHLNTAGAEELSVWLGEQLKSEISTEK